MLKVSFWNGKNGAMVSHGKGLNADDVAALATLKVGDRLAVWPNQFRNGDYSPDFTLKVFIPKKVEVVDAAEETVTLDEAASE